jgi:hypothetical protein
MRTVEWCVHLDTIENIEARLRVLNEDAEEARAEHDLNRLHRRLYDMVTLTSEMERIMRKLGIGYGTAA